MEKEAYTIKNNETCEIEIKKSIFIANIIKVENINDANEALRLIRKKYYDATHNCYAYFINDNDTTIEKASDDGEPSQTAGPVILNVIKQNKLENVLIVITRYFGGIKLGAGGLVRAYSKSASEVVSKCEIFKIIKKELLKIEIDYQYLNEVTRYLSSFECSDKVFLDKVSLTYNIDSSKIEEVKANLIELTKGSIVILSI